MGQERDEVKGAAPRQGIMVKADGSSGPVGDTVACEARLTLYLNGGKFTDMVASRDQLRELGAGFVICEGLAPAVEEVRVEGDKIYVTAPVRAMAGTEIGSSGGVSIETPPGRVGPGIVLTPAEVLAVTRELESELWRKTGGVHCSVLYCGGRVTARSSDVGRHNTVDKVVGAAYLAGIDLSRCAIGCTGRQPAGMVIKAARAGVPIIISRAASTDRGIAAAGEAGITLVCFSRGDRFTVYTHPGRISGLISAEGRNEIE
jgi:FdhD protein